MKLKKISSWILGFSVRMVVLLIMVSVLYMACTKAYNFGVAIFSEEGVARSGQGEDVLVNIPVGSTNQEVGTILYDAGLISDVNIFTIQMFIYQGEINDGVYMFNTENSPEDIIEKITDGVTVQQDGTGER